MVPAPPRAMSNLDHIRLLLRDPRGHELEIGLALNAMTDADLGRLGHGSLTKLVKSLIAGPGVGVDYSTVMRWCRAASVLDGADDPRAEWGISRLAEVGKVPTRGELRVPCIVRRDVDPCPSSTSTPLEPAATIGSPGTACPASCVATSIPGRVGRRRSSSTRMARKSPWPATRSVRVDASCSAVTEFLKGGTPPDDRPPPTLKVRHPT